MKTFREISRERKKAIRAILDPENVSVGHVAEAAGVHANTIIRYTQEEDFMRILLDAKKALDKSD